MALYFPDEVDEYRTFVEIGDMVDGVVPRDEYIDDMFAISMSQIDGIVQPELASPFDLFRVCVIKVAEEIPNALTLDFSNGDVIVVDDLFEGLVGPIKKVSDFVDPPLSFDALSGFVSHSDNVHDSSFMDLSIFEY